MIPNDEMEDISKIVKSLEDSRPLLEGVSEVIKNEAKTTTNLQKRLITTLLNLLSALKHQI